MGFRVSDFFQLWKNLFTVAQGFVHLRGFHYCSLECKVILKILIEFLFYGGVKFVRGGRFFRDIKQCAFDFSGLEIG